MAYVLRRIIRRGLRHGYKLDIKEPFFHKLVDVLVDEMGDAFPVLAEQREHVINVLRNEEEKFSETLSQGMEILKAQIAKLDTKTIPGEFVFQLYDTYGFPADLTADIARERDLEVDMPGFEEAMEAQRARGRAATSFATSLGQKVSVSQAVEFGGYENVENVGCVLGVFDSAGDPVAVLNENDKGILVLDNTTFYAESGGQVGDKGTIATDTFEFDVEDTLITGPQFMHIGRVRKGQVQLNEEVRAQVDQSRRDKIRCNHSATHLLHAALREVLGKHVQQKGSLVNDEKLRFDFSHEELITNHELQDIEDRVNAQILLNTPVTTELMAHEEALKAGAMALFGEKYDDEVRVLSMGDGYSVELCGGTHVARTGDIGLLKLVSSSSTASGTRRIEAVTGQGALAWVREQQQVLDSLSQTLKVPNSELVERVKSTLDENKQLTKSLEAMSQKQAAAQSAGLVDQVENLGEAQFIATEVSGDGKAMMQTLDSLRAKIGDKAVIVLAQNNGGKVNMVVASGKGISAKVNASDLLQTINPHVGAKGGGRPDLARAGGGSNPDGLADGFAAAREFVNHLMVG